MNEYQIILSQPLTIQYNKEALIKKIDEMLEVANSIVVTEHNKKDCENRIADLNKNIKFLSDTRKNIIKEAMLPLKDFETTVKDCESKLSEAYRIIKNQIDEYTIAEQNKNKETLIALFNEYCEANGVPQELMEYIELPELTGTLSNSSFTPTRAKKKIKEVVEVAMKNHEIIVNQVGDINFGFKLQIKPEYYYRFLYDLNTFFKELNADKDKILNFSKEKEEVKQEEIKNENPNEIIKLVIELNKNEVQKAILLKKFLDEQAIKYEVVK